VKDGRVAKTLSEAQQISIRTGPDEFRGFFEREMQGLGTVVRENIMKLSSS